MRSLVCVFATLFVIGCASKSETSMGAPPEDAKNSAVASDISLFEGLDYPGAKLAPDTAIMGGKNVDGSGVSGQFITSDKVSKVLDFYKLQVAVSSHSLAGDNGTLTGRAKSGKILNVLVMKEGDNTLITLSLANEKK